MRKLITLVVAFIVLATTTQAQTKVQTTDKPVKDTVVNTITYKLYVGSRGGRYIIMKSKSGNEYKRYFHKKK